MKNIFLAICVCSMIFGFSATLYAYPTLGNDCTACHNGNSGRGGGTGADAVENDDFAMPTEDDFEANAAENDDFAAPAEDDNGFDMPAPFPERFKTDDAEGDDFAAPGETDGGFDMPAPFPGRFKTDVTEEDGFTVIQPDDKDKSFPVRILDNPVLQKILKKVAKKMAEKIREKMIEKLKEVASQGLTVIIPGQGKDDFDTDAFMDDKNSDPSSKFFKKFDLNDVDTISGE